MSTFISYPLPQSFEASGTSTITTTSATPAVVTGMTLSPTPGTYIAIFSACIVSPGTSSTMTFGLYVGGTLKADSLRTIQPYDGGALAAATADAAVALNGLITVTAGQAVTIQWASTGGGTATCNQRTLNLILVL